ncbi:MAG TPA: cytidine/deoxycytidylate deaminase family protein [Candidatus Bathyarchaeia archaeon]|nr:cytidine/deoxycytidylate deaminase family protein [Candidatus Bathyarchaeia archaeon]
MSKKTDQKNTKILRTRPTVDEYFTAMAELVSTRSTCLRRQFGTVIVQNNHVISTGYNGAPKDMPHCIEIGCLRDELSIPSGTKHEVCRGVHSEQNAIIQCAIHGESTKDATLYVTGYPCKICAKMIINAMINRVVISGNYSDTEGISLLEQAGVQVTILDINAKVTLDKVIKLKESWQRE